MLQRVGVVSFMMTLEDLTYLDIDSVNTHEDNNLSSSQAKNEGKSNLEKKNDFFKSLFARLMRDVELNNLPEVKDLNLSYESLLIELDLHLYDRLKLSETLKDYISLTIEDLQSLYLNEARSKSARGTNQYDKLTVSPLSKEKGKKDVGTEKNIVDDIKVRIHEIPVCYQPLKGLDNDIEQVSKHTNYSVEEIIKLHCASQYRVFAVGFLPHFAYLGELAEGLECPRLASPRKKVLAGAVAIADLQTAIYPSDSPGGWHIIGYTPFVIGENDLVFQSGDLVRFRAIDEQEYRHLNEYKVAN